MQCKENHICSNRGGCAVPGKLHSAVPEEGMQYQDSHNYTTTGGCIVTGE